MLRAQNRKGIFDVELPYAQPGVLSERHSVVVEAFGRLADVNSHNYFYPLECWECFERVLQARRVPRAIFIHRISAKFLAVTCVRFIIVASLFWRLKLFWPDRSRLPSSISRWLGATNTKLGRSEERRVGK